MQLPAFSSHLELPGIGDGILQGFFLRRVLVSQFQADGTSLFRDLSHLFFQLCTSLFQAFMKPSAISPVWHPWTAGSCALCCPAGRYCSCRSSPRRATCQSRKWFLFLLMTVQFRLLLLQILFQHFHTVSEPVDFLCRASQQVAVILKGTACQGTACSEILNGHHPGWYTDISWQWRPWSIWSTTRFLPSR